MSSPVVNIAILGAGRQAYVHAAAIVSVGAPARFYASYDLFQSASEKLSASHAHAPKVAASIEEVLADPNVHAIVVCTPNNTHAELVIRVAAAGKACLCEKPLDTELAAIEKFRSALKELEKTQKLPYIAVGFPKRHDPSFAVLRNQLKLKTFGRLELLAFNMRDESPQPTAYMKYSGGMINDTCVHDFDLARSLLDDDDEFDTVFAHGSSLIDPAACEEAGDVMRDTINLKTKKGVLFTLNNARRCVVGNDQRVEAQCELGDLIATNHARNDVNVVVSTATSGGSVQPWKSATSERYAPRS